MADRFDNVPVDEDTKIRGEKKIRFGPYEALLQKWSWEGISAESVILVSGDVSILSDEELERVLQNSGLVKEKSGVTVKRSDSGFTFVNFNFRES